VKIAAVGSALPEHRYDQETLIEAFRDHWKGRLRNAARLEQIHKNCQVAQRHLALPLEAYPALRGFGDANDAYIRIAQQLGERAIRDALDRASLAPRDVDAFFFTTVTGLATPSIDARLVNRMGFRSDVKRTPIFGLGCVAGTAGVARAADYLRAYPDQVALLLAVELCSLTLQRADLSIANLVASGLFGDGAAAVLLTGSAREARGPAVLDSRSVFYPDTEDAMGWEIGADGFRIVLSGEVPSLAEKHLRGDVDAFLAEHSLRRDDIAHWICHPGGPRVLEAFESALERPREAFARTWRSLAELGNLSSASVLHVLRDTLSEAGARPGDHGLMLSMGPGFCAELVLLRW
jgi:alkylresorcinol/alkylpyrone synthase